MAHIEVARPSDGSKDVGADEVSNDLVDSGPLSNIDIGGTIGPSWSSPALFV